MNEYRLHKVAGSDSDSNPYHLHDFEYAGAQRLDSKSIRGIDNHDGDSFTHDFNNNLTLPASFFQGGKDDVVKPGKHDETDENGEVKTYGRKVTDFRLHAICMVWQDPHDPKKANRTDHSISDPKQCHEYCRSHPGSSKYFFMLVSTNGCHCATTMERFSKCAHGGGPKSNYEFAMYVLYDPENLPVKKCWTPPAKPIHSKSHCKTAVTANKNASPEQLAKSKCSCVPEDGYLVKENSFQCVTKGDPLHHSWADFDGRCVIDRQNCKTPSPQAMCEHATNKTECAQFDIRGNQNIVFHLYVLNHHPCF